MQNLPKKLYTASQVKRLDKLAIEQGIAGIELMRRAGQVVFDIIQHYFPTHKIIIYCGNGNNGGDGYVVAKLALQAGFEVATYHISPPHNLPSDARIAYQDYLAIKGHVTSYITQPQLSTTVHGNHNVIIDALLGVGLNREVTGAYADAIALINDSNCPVIAIDIPSGLHADSGNVLTCAVKAHYSASFVGLKQGMFTGMAAQHCGKISYSSLGIPEQVLQQVNHSAELTTGFSPSKRHRCCHKGDNGHVLLVGGYKGYCGAIRLAAEASLRIGAGLVSIATHKNHAALINIRQPELMCHGIDTHLELMPLLDKASVIVIGCGLGQSKWAMDLFACVLQSKKPLVLDADALNLLAIQTIYNDNWVLTPHIGEAARLLKQTKSATSNNRFLAVSTLQKTYGGVAILKGAGTLTDNGIKITIANSGNPGMASAGMGDVLAGMIGGLIAQGAGLSSAATAAVYLHGRAADLCVQQDGEIGLVASDLMPFIRHLMNENNAA